MIFGCTYRSFCGAQGSRSTVRAVLLPREAWRRAAKDPQSARSV